MLRRLWKQSMLNVPPWRRPNTGCRMRLKISWWMWRGQMLRLPLWTKSKETLTKYSKMSLNLLLKFYGGHWPWKHIDINWWLKMWKIMGKKKTRILLFVNVGPIWVEAEVWWVSVWAGELPEGGTVSEHWALQTEELLRGISGSPWDHEAREQEPPR